VAEGATERGKVTYVASRNKNANCYEEIEATFSTTRDIIKNMYNNNNNNNNNNLLTVKITFCRLTVGPTLPPTHLVQEALSPGVKWQGPEADYSPPSIVEVKKSGAIPPLHHKS
jgi:hypothetical protein